MESAWSSLVHRASRWEVWILAVFGVLLLGRPGVGNAGTVMLQAPATIKSAENSEVYPASEFGKPPERRRFPMVADPLSAREEVNEWPAPDPVAVAGRQIPDPSEQTVRKPASLSDESVVQGPGTVRVQRPNALNPPAGMEAQAMSRKGVQEIAIIAGDSGFFPRTLFVTRDIPVRLYVTGASKNTLCMMMDGFQVRKQIRSQKIEEISFTPNVPGKYRFYCPVNGMEGNLIVRELASVEGG